MMRVSLEEMRLCSEEYINSSVVNQGGRVQQNIVHDFFVGHKVG